MLMKERYLEFGVACSCTAEQSEKSQEVFHIKSAHEITHGFWFWIYLGYSYILLVVGTIFILRSFTRTKGLFRRQNFILLIAVLTPWLGNILYVFDLFPIPNLDITPFAFA